MEEAAEVEGHFEESPTQNDCRPQIVLLRLKFKLH